jgi:hypothetical protein
MDRAGIRGIPQDKIDQDRDIAFFFCHLHPVYQANYRKQDNLSDSWGIQG